MFYLEDNKNTSVCYDDFPLWLLRFSGELFDVVKDSSLWITFNQIIMVQYILVSVMWFRTQFHYTYFCCYFYIFCLLQWSSSNFLVVWSILQFDVDKPPVSSEENGAIDILYKLRQTFVDRFYYRHAHAQPLPVISLVKR